MRIAKLSQTLLTAAGMVLAAAVAGAATLPSTTTQLSLSKTTVKQGTAVSLRAVVATGAGSVTQGQVLFCDTTHVTLCTPAGANVLALAQVTPAGTASRVLRLGIGAHPIVARFLGTTSDAGSSSAAATVTVQPAGGRKTTQVSLTATPVNYETEQGLYNLSASVTTPGGGVPATGTMTFQVSSPHTTTVLGTPTLTTSGQPLTGFGAPPTSPAGRGNPVIADWNEDGIPDLALVEASGLAVAVLPGVGDGTFPAPSSTNAVAGLCAANGCVAVATADFNGDGHADLVALSPLGSAYSLQFAYGKGDGTFTLSTAVAVALGPGLSTPQLVVGDYNGDGQPDLVVNGTVSSGASFGVALQQPDHSFVLTYPTDFGSAGVTPPAMLQPADIDGDGKTDLVGLNSKGIVTFASNGDGTFTGKVVGAAEGTPYLFAVGDFNADGAVDAIVFTQPNYVSLGTPLFNDGHGTLTAGSTLAVDFPPNTGLLSVDAVDVNGDGVAEVLLVQSDDTRAGGNGPLTIFGIVFTSDGKNGFTENTSYLPPEGVNALVSGPLVAADLNGDGLQDVVYHEESSACCTVLLNQSGAGYSSAGLTNVPMPVGSFNGLSLIASYGGDTRYLPSVSPAASVDGTPATTTLQLTALPSSVPAGGSLTLTATLAPYTAQGYSTDGEVVTFYFNNQQSYSSTLHGGRATFITSQLPVGQYQFVAAYEGDGVFLASTSTAQPVVITPAGSGDAGLLGSYVFHYSGMLAGGKAGVAAGIAGVGVINTDGKGGLGGEEDTNSAASTIAGSNLTGGYTLNANGTGTIRVVNDHGIEQDFVIVLSSRDSTTGIAAGFTLMGIGPSGEVISGRAVLQPNAYTSTGGFMAMLGGSYTVSLAGETACTGTGTCAGTAHKAGAVSDIGSIFFSNGTGTGPVVGNVAGTLGIDPAAAFTVAAADPYGRAVLTVKSTVAPLDQPQHFAGYYATSAEMFLISTDPHASSILLSGLIEKQ